VAMNAQSGGQQLPCGRYVEDIAVHLDHGGSDAHSRTCEHCLVARESLGRLAVATQLLRDDPAAPPPNLLDRIMSAVRAEFRSSDALPLPTPSGPSQVAHAAVAAVLRYAADGVTGVWSRHCRITPVTANGPEVRVEMSLSVRVDGPPIAEVVAEVRRRLVAALSGQVGLVATVVDVVVADVWSQEDA